MTSSADVEVVATEGALAVVTGHATLATASRMMIERFGGCYLPPLRHSSPYLMAFVARHLLMFRMAEAHTICLREHRRSRIAAELMTRTTRGNVAPA